MLTGLEWCNPIGIPQVKQELEKTDTAEDVTKAQETVQTQDQPLQGTEERQAEDEVESGDTHEATEEMEDDSDETKDGRKNIKEKSGNSR